MGFFPSFPLQFFLTTHGHGNSLRFGLRFFMSFCSRNIQSDSLLLLLPMVLFKATVHLR